MPPASQDDLQTGNCKEESSRALRSTEIYPSLPEQHPRPLRKMLVYALGSLANAFAKLPSVGLCLNVTKSESLLERYDSSSGHTLTRGTFCVTKYCWGIASSRLKMYRDFCPVRKINILLDSTIAMEEDD